jgi:hypothetical protein
MTCYEYKVVKNPKNFFLCEDQEQWLNEMGASGWELVSYTVKVIPQECHESEFYIFKRSYQEGAV